MLSDRSQVIYFSWIFQCITLSFVAHFCFHMDTKIIFPILTYEVRPISYFARSIRYSLNIGMPSKVCIVRIVHRKETNCSNKKSWNKIVVMGIRESCFIDNIAVWNISGSSDLIWHVYVSLSKMKMVWNKSIWYFFSHRKHLLSHFVLVICYQLFIIG